MAPTTRLAVTVILVFAVAVCTTIVIFYKQIDIIGTPISFRTQRALNSFFNKSNDSPKVVCMIHTTPDTWMTRARAVRHTWGPRCTFSVYFYSNKAASMDHVIRQAPDAVGLDVEHGRGHLTAKTRAGLKYSFEKYGKQAEWYMKADDDTYLVWENLVSFLNELQSREKTNANVTNGAKMQPFYAGRRFFNVPNLPHGYNSGGGGYVLSEPAARMLLEGPDKHPRDCVKDGGWEDMETGRCLASFGVYPADTFDKNGKLRFHCSTPLGVLAASSSSYYIQLGGAVFGSLSKTEKNQMLSETAVTFHYITPAQMFMFDYLLYYMERGDTSVRRDTGEQHLHSRPTENVKNDSMKSN